MYSSPKLLSIWSNWLLRLRPYLSYFLNTALISAIPSPSSLYFLLTLEVFYYFMRHRPKINTPLYLKLTTHWCLKFICLISNLFFIICSIFWSFILIACPGGLISLQLTNKDYKNRKKLKEISVLHFIWTYILSQSVK